MKIYNLITSTLWSIHSKRIPQRIMNIPREIALKKPYQLIEVTYESLKIAYTAKTIKKGNYAFVITNYGEGICITVSKQNFNQLLSRLDEILSLFKVDNLDLLFLIEPKAPPRTNQRPDGILTSLVFNQSYLSVILANGGEPNLPWLCYQAAKTIIDSNQSARTLIRTFDDLASSKVNIDSLPTLTGERSSMKVSDNLTLVIPHQGNLAYLETCLEFLRHALYRPINTWVYFDETVTPEHTDLTRAYTYPVYRRVAPPNLGPYVPRNHCIEYANTEYICFQDSDDLPTYERFLETQKFVKNNLDVDMAGCHELRLDEIYKKLFIYRFPLNVTQALNQYVKNPLAYHPHPLFHPTSFVKRSSLQKAGLFSSIRRFGSDKQFLLRSHFSMKIRNMDKFLYIRRNRAGSLTTAPATKMGSYERNRLNAWWRSDFKRVCKGDLNLKDSSLMTEHLDRDVDIIDL